jgi:hypothetical protein
LWWRVRRRRLWLAGCAVEERHKPGKAFKPKFKLIVRRQPPPPPPCVWGGRVACSALRLSAPHISLADPSVGVRPRRTQVPSHKGELRTFSLIAKGKEEMEGWLAALRAAVARADQKLLQARQSASAAPLRSLAALGLPGHCGYGGHDLGGRAAQFCLFV